MPGGLVQFVLTRFGVLVRFEVNMSQPNLFYCRGFSGFQPSKSEFLALILACCP